MGKRSVATALGIAVIMFGASNASAAVEVGNDCAANTGAGGAITYLQIARATPNPASLITPSAGVITSWKVNVGFPVLVSEKLKVFRSGSKATQFTTVAESTPEFVSQGTNVFQAQIPVKAGDRIGASGAGTTPAVLYCTTGNPGDEYGAAAGDPPVGTPTEFGVGAGLLIAISAVVEPDADGDGFGDETQDKCPRSAKLQTECPLIVLSSFGIASRNSALILVASSSATPVILSATVKVPGKAKNGKKGKAKTLKLNGPTQTVAPGQLARFVVPYSVPLKAALTALSPKRSLSLQVSATATDATGLPSVSTTALRLKGQGKAKK